MTSKVLACQYNHVLRALGYYKLKTCPQINAMQIGHHIRLYSPESSSDPGVSPAVLPFSALVRIRVSKAQACIFMQVFWSLHVQELALFPGVKRSKGQVSAGLNCHEYHALHIPSIYLHIFVTLNSQLCCLQVFIMVAYIVLWNAKYSLRHTHPVATTQALNESCKFSWSWTLLSRRDYLPVKPGAYERRKVAGRSVKLPYISWSHPLPNLAPSKCAVCTYFIKKPSRWLL